MLHKDDYPELYMQVSWLKSILLLYINVMFVHYVEVILTKDTGRSLDVTSQSLTHTCASGDLCPLVSCENVRPWVSGAAVNVAAVLIRLKYTVRWFSDRTHRAMMRAAMFLNPLPQCTRLPLRMRDTLAII